MSRGRAAFLAVLAAVLAAHTLTVVTAGVHWDEFALLARAEAAARTGTIGGGGRPGLGTVLLIPFAEACVNAARTLVKARLLWLAFVAASVPAYLLLLRRALVPSSTRWMAMAIGVVLWVLAPDFLRYSIQVRTDQPAILLGLWGGVALCASRRRAALALPAGLLFASGFLFSQKCAYVGGFCAVVAAAEHLRDRDFDVPRLLLRGLAFLSAFAVVLLSYRVLVSRGGSAPTMAPVLGALNVFAYYRAEYGWRLYLGMLPGLIPQLGALLLLVVVSLGLVGAERKGHVSQLLLAWGVVGIGAAVAIFHAARLPYFYMVLGLFPATVGALVTGPFLDMVARRRWRLAVLVPLGTLTLLGALGQTAAQLVDDRARQAAAIDFVSHAYPASARGFDTFGVFTCRHDPDPFPVRFRQHLFAADALDGGAELTRDLITEFRERPVAFSLPPTTFYPEPFHEFWRARYVQYWESVWIPGAYVGGAADGTREFEVLVAGEYRWLPEEGSEGLLVDGVSVGQSQSVHLDAGRHALHAADGVKGRFVLALDEPYRAESGSFFTLYW